MIQISEKMDCCGCGACVQSCPKKCIKLHEDLEGFLYPKIEKQNCIDCGLCELTCPIINKRKNNNSLLKSYIAIAKDTDTRLNSSSGGIFSIFAEKILEKKGRVFGAAFDCDNKKLHHIGISNKADLFKLQGSKYLQSSTENCYREVKFSLERGETVLFSGTSCQISGLKKFLKIEYQNLITIDVLCHGVPSPKVWKKYLCEQEKLYGAKSMAVSFRNKEQGWKKFLIHITFENGKKYEQIHTSDRYMTFFLKNLSLRPSCYKCQFKDLNRDSDITIGDCWGVENYMPHMDDDLGTSIVVVHTDKGLDLINQISEKVRLCEAEVDRALPPTADSRRSVLMPKYRDKFFKMLNKKSTLYLLEFVNNTSTLNLKSMIKRIIIYFKIR